VSAEQPQSEDGWPDHVMTWIHTAAAGGSADMQLRWFLPFLGEKLGVTQIVQNVDGGGGSVGLQQQLQAVPDGYTIGWMGIQKLGVMNYFQNLTDFTIDDFRMINLERVDPVGIFALNDSPYETFDDVIEDARNRPGKVSITCTMNGAGYFFLLGLEKALDIDFAVVPYDSGSENKAQFLGKHVDLLASQEWSAYELRSEAKALGIAWDHESVLWPEGKLFTEILKKYGITDTVTTISANYISSYVDKDFVEQYPERFEKLVNAMYAAHESEGYQQVLEGQHLKSYCVWYGPEESQRLIKEAIESMKIAAEILNN
jgi:tripartite-type tricarboxylate transporter receptor subunit TctC